MAGLGAIAITDHDATSAVEAARAVVAERGLRLEVLMGVEINTVWRDAEIHVLGYFFDPGTPGWHETMRRQQGERMRRMTRYVEALEGHGVPVTLAAVQEQAGAGSLGRPHLARALVAAGHASSEQAAFDRFLTPGCPTYVPREGLSPFEAIALIRAAGGVSSLAHPFSVSLSDPSSAEDPRSLIECLVAAGLDALEVVHPSQSPMLRNYYAGMAGYYGLLSTGGSDDHGPRPGRPARIGSEAVDYAWVSALRERRKAVASFGSLGRKPL